MGVLEDLAAVIPGVRDEDRENPILGFELPGVRLRGLFMDGMSGSSLAVRISWLSPCCGAKLAWQLDSKKSRCGYCQNEGALFPFIFQDESLTASLEVIAAQRSEELSLGLDPLQTEVLASELHRNLRTVVLGELGSWPGSV